MTAAAFTGYLALIATLGQALVAMVVRRARLPLALHVGTVALTGMTALSLAVTWRGLAGLPVQLWLPVVLGLGGLALAVTTWRRGWGRPERPTLPRGREWLRLLPLLPLLPAGLLVLLDAVQTPMFAWDAFAIWDFKAKALLTGGLLDNAAFTDPNLAFNHPEYPLLVPAQFLTVHNLANTHTPVGSMLAAVLAYPLLLGLLWAGLRERIDRLPAAVVLALLGLCPAFLYQATTAYADVHLAFFLLGVLVFLGRWLADRRRHDLWLAGFALAGLVFTKNEGLTFAVLATVGICLAATGAGRWRPLAALGGAVAIHLPFFVWRQLIPPTVEGYAGRLSPPLIVERLDRLPAILGGLAAQFGDLANWGILWYALLLAAACGWPAWRHRRALWLWTVLAGQLAIYMLAYLVSPWQLGPHLATSADRLVLHLAIPAVLLVAEHWRTSKGG